MGRPHGSKNIEHVSKIKLVCDYCNIDFELYPSHVSYLFGGTSPIVGRGRFCSMNCQRKGTKQVRAAAISGDNNANWTGGGSSYRQRAIKFYGAKCAGCGYTAQIELLQAHHLNFKSRLEQDDHSLENLIVLCIRCHYERHIKEGKAIEDAV